ncbi:MAG: SGNH/GDSL hydrolase family protein [Polyangiaceae bacterium]
MSSPSPSVLRKVGSKLALLLTSVVLVLALCELALRVAAPERKTFNVWPPRMTHTFHANADVMPGHLPTSKFTVDSLGLRGPEPGPDTDLRILAIGGSTTECLYVDDASAWPLRLSRLLGATADGRPVWSASAGMSGMNSGDHVTHARYLVPELPRIDIVVSLVGVNDLTLALGTPEAYKPVPRDSTDKESLPLLARAFRQIPGRFDRIEDYDSAFYHRLALYQLYRRFLVARSREAATTQLVNNDGGTLMDIWRAHRRNATAHLDTLPDLAPLLEVYKANLRTFVDLLKERSIRVILLTQPTLWRDDLSEEEQKVLWMGGKGGDFMRQEGFPYYTPGALAKGMQAFNSAVLEVCKERNIECFDLASRIPKDRSFFYDDCHFADRGSEQLADLIADQLKRSPPFAPKSP